MKTSLFLGILLSGLATITGVISTAIPYWMYKKIVGQKFYAGLWQSCLEIASTTTCFKISIKDAPDWFRTVEALTVIGLVLLGLSCLMALCYARAGSQTMFVTLGALCAFLGAIAFTVAVIIFGVKDKKDVYVLPGLNPDLHAGFYLGIVAAVLGFLGSIAIFSSKRAEGYSSI